ncbi:MAG TPA: hypothetical protein VEX18_06545 [Polyangiaceae bacterium]|nr:hypothetical protein [Polyangiaceae bacterium]
MAGGNGGGGGGGRGGAGGSGGDNEETGEGGGSDGGASLAGGTGGTGDSPEPGHLAHFGSDGDYVALPLAVAATPNGRIALAGRFSGDLDLGDGDPLVSEPNARAMFLVVYDAAFEIIYKAKIMEEIYRAVDSYTLESRVSLLFDESGNLMIAGYAAFDLTLDGESLVEGAARPRTFIAKLDPEGNLLDSMVYGGTGIQFAHSMALAPNGHAFVYGRFRGVLELGGACEDPVGPDPEATDEDLYLAEHDEDLNCVSVVQVSGTDILLNREVAVTEGGDVIVSGVYSGTLSFEGEEFTSPNQIHSFVRRIGANPDDSYFANLASADTFTAVNLIADGNDVLASGQVGEPFPQLGISEGFGDIDMFVARLGAAGDVTAAHIIGSSAQDQNAYAFPLPGGGTRVYGNFSAALQSGSLSLPEDEDGGAFIADLDDALAPETLSALGGAGHERIARVAIAGGFEILAGNVIGPTELDGVPVETAELGDIFLLRRPLD